MKLLHFFAVFLCTTALALAAEVPRIAPAEAAKRAAESKAVIVDVREPAECAATGVARPAVLLPKSDFDGDQKLWKPFLASLGDKEVILYCHSGRRAGLVGAALARQGIKVANAGGLRDWTAAGLPLRKVAPAP
ncbi:MAG: rhodanese-like domain-containing protein [Acetobacteraceae bacterium]